MKDEEIYGLSASEVEAAKARKEINKIKNPTNKSYFGIIISNVFTPFNILMVCIAALLFIFVGSDVIGNLLFLVIIIFNVLIGTIQECKSKAVIEKLKLLSENKIKVIRSGQEVEIRSSEILLGDAVILSTGDQIPVDCTIINDTAIEVDESLLTGESIAVKKSTNDFLYAGSYITSGRCIVKAEKVGNNTYIHSIESKAKGIKKTKSLLMLSIKKIIRTMACIGIPLGLIVFWKYVINPINKAFSPSLFVEWTRIPYDTGTLFNNIQQGLFYGGTTITYMIPCGMLLLASIAMATGVIKLSQVGVMTQDLYSVESLSRVDTLCLDKTGTLTDGTMTVEEPIILKKDISENELFLLMCSYVNAFKSTNQTSKALKLKYNLELKKEVEEVIEFSSARKFSAVKFKESDKWLVLGAPEYLTTSKKILSTVSENTEHGLRVLLLSETNNAVSETEKLKGLKPVALFIIKDNIRKEVPDTMKWFRENDVDIRVISGDNVKTVSYIAKMSGIENWDKSIDLSLFPVDDPEFERIVLENKIFGRVSPEQKAAIVDILKKHGKTVAMTGDGVNDILALKKADCSIALANGASSTKNIANLVLLNSDFSTMKEAVFQGRRVVNNIQRSATLFVMKDFLWMFIALMPFILGVPHTIEPTVMSLINIFVTGLASFFISLEPDKTRVTGNFFKSVTKGAIISGFFMFIPVFLIMVYLFISSKLNVNADLIKSWIPIFALTITVSGLIVFWDKCRPFTKYRMILFSITLFLITFMILGLPQMYLVNSTEYMRYLTGGNKLPIFELVKKLVTDIWTHQFFDVMHNGANNFYAGVSYLKDGVTPEMWIFFATYCVISVPLYFLNKKVTGKALDYLLFSPRNFEDVK